MYIKSLTLILLSSWLVLTPAKPARSYRLAYYNAPAQVKGIDNMDDLISPAISEDDDYEDDYSVASSRKSSNPATGRLFFNRLFQNRQPIIPIIITGAGNTNANPGGVTTGSIPQATGTITTSPVAGRGQNDSEEGDAEEEAEKEQEYDNGSSLHKQQIALQNAIAVAAQEYVASNAPIKGTSNEVTDQLSLRDKDDKDNYIKVRIPAKYRKYFKNGQRVYLRRPSNNNNNRRRRNQNRNRRREVRN